MGKKWNFLIIDFIYQSMDLLLENSVYKAFNILVFLARSPCWLVAKFLIHCFSVYLFISTLIKDSYYLRAGDYLDQSPQFAEKDIKHKKVKLLICRHTANLVVQLVSELYLPALPWQQWWV